MRWDMWEKMEGSHSKNGKNEKKGRTKLKRGCFMSSCGSLLLLLARPSLLVARPLDAGSTGN